MEVVERRACSGSTQQPERVWKVRAWPFAGCGTLGTTWRIWRMVQLAGAAGKGSMTSRRLGLPPTLPRQAMLPTLMLPSLKLFSCALRMRHDCVKARVGVCGVSWRARPG